MPVLECCSAVWCSAADTHLGSQWCQFLTGGVFECDIAHRRSVAVLCMLYKLRCNTMHPHYAALPVPYVPVWLQAALIAQQYTYAPPSCEPRSIAGLLFACQYLCGTILMISCSMVWDWRVSRAGPIPFYWPSC